MHPRLKDVCYICDLSYICMCICHQLGMLHRLTHTQMSLTSGFEVTANLNTRHLYECILSLIVTVFFCLYSSRRNHTT